MTFPLRVLFVLAVTCTPVLAQLSASQPIAIDSAMKAIHPEAIRAHMRFLSSDALKGRRAGTEGYQVAALYVASQMEALGLKPAGVNGSWFQAVRLLEFQAIPERTSLELVHDAKAEPLKFGEDFVTEGSALHAEAALDAPVVFVGFGVTAPELKYDDYANVDIRGKVVVWIQGAPASFPTSERAYFSDALNKARNAVGRGAVGAMTILAPEEQQRYPWNWIAPQVISGGMSWLDGSGVPHNTFPELRGGGLLSQHGAELLFAGAPKTLARAFEDAKAGKPQAFALPVAARMRTASRHVEVQSPNIIGALPGSDPSLRHEYVVYTAHLDHLGTCPPVNGDDVCHGAADNASGVAALLEIARAFASLPQPPRRSVLFAFVTGEEEGLLGSDYFANAPTVPLPEIVANINLDGAIGLFYPLKDVVALGAEHSTLARAVDDAAKRLGYEVSPDPMPEEVFFIRSDQYSLVQQGVPAVALSDGFKSADPRLNGEEISKKWLVTVYHTPRDNMDQPFDFQSATKGTALNFLVGYDVAQQPRRPTWNGGDFFGAKFGQKGRTAPTPR